MGAAAAIILRRERDIVNTYRAAGAIDARSARDPDALGVARRVAFTLLIRHGVLREAGDGRFYLDEARWIAVRARRRRTAFVLLIVVFAVITLLTILGIVTFGAVHPAP